MVSAALLLGACDVPPEEAESTGKVEAQKSELLLCGFNPENGFSCRDGYTARWEDERLRCRKYVGKETRRLSCLGVYHYEVQDKRDVCRACVNILGIWICDDQPTQGCPDGFDRDNDADGNRDLCVKPGHYVYEFPQECTAIFEGPPSQGVKCPAATTSADFDDGKLRCRKDTSGDVEPPTCSGGGEQVPLPGPDACLGGSFSFPKCASGYTYVRDFSGSNADRCVRIASTEWLFPVTD
jgi:hypothetical protein